MSDITNIFLSSTLIGTFIASSVNLLISYLTLRNYKKSESEKTLIAFRSKNLEILASLREIAVVGSTVKPLIEAIESNNSQGLVNIVIEENDKTRHRIKEYKKSRHSFRKIIRMRLDKLVSDFELLDYNVAQFAVELTEKHADVHIETLADKIKKLVNAAQSFDVALAKEIDNEVCWLADWIESH